jgi:hypothetical protein
MKVIDLLNKIANGETKEEIMFQYNNGYEEYANINTLFDRFTINKENLNTEIEIIEEDKKIEKIDMFDYFTGYDFDNTSIDLRKHLEINFQILNIKINEIIEHLNKGE